MIEFKNVTKIFKSKDQTVKAMDSVNLKIEDGDIYGIVGFSGAGKTTLLRCINALERPTSGQVLIDGEDIQTLSRQEIRQKRKRIGMIFQQFNLLSTKTVYQNIALPLILNHVPGTQIREKVEKVMEYVELSDKRNAYPSQLSGGQKQRVGIARALVTDPSILLSDESTSALDPKTTRSILMLLKRINRELGITIVLITHEMSVIQTICNHMSVMEKGRVVEQGDVLEVFGNPQQEITRNFIKTVIHDDIPELLVPGIRAEKRNNVLLRLQFQDDDSTESILSQVNKRYDVSTNILFANISEIQEQVLGIIIVQMIGENKEIALAEQYFTDHHVGYRELTV